MRRALLLLLALCLLFVGLVAGYGRPDGPHPLLQGDYRVGFTSRRALAGGSVHDLWVQPSVCSLPGLVAGSQT